MSRWMERRGLKLTSLGERVLVSLAGLGIVTLCGAGFLFEAFINTQIGA
ncbi:hypothetical protein BV113_00070 [Glutamicibacter phage BIM BV-113]|nr:hypothetical protein BV113_00070 [Glutamicibacter phage BIM BV-113]